MLAYNKSIGGLKAIEANNRKKGELLYGCIDKHAGFYKPFVTEKADRSLMNVDFFLPTEELTDTFVKDAKKAGMVGPQGLPGHRRHPRLHLQRRHRGQREDPGGIHGSLRQEERLNAGIRTQPGAPSGAPLLQGPNGSTFMCRI